MANKKITELNAASSLAATDVVPVVDVSADETKKITATDLFRTLPDGTAAAPSLSFASDAGNGVFLAGTDTVGISTGGTQRVTVDGSGNVTISGDLQVDGATTTVQSTTVTIDDKNIELGSVASPSNTTADGGGITLKGATDKTLKWINSTGCWTFNQPMNFNDHVRIDSSGQVGIGTTSPSSYGGAVKLALTSSGNTSFTIASGTSSDGTILFADGTSGDATYRGQVKYSHSSDAMLFNTAATERLRIDSSGRLLVGTTATSVHADRLIEIGNTSRSATFQAITTSTSGTGGIVFADTITNDTGGYRGSIQYVHSSDSLLLNTAATERLRITSTGLIDVSGGIQVSENVTPTSGSGVEIFKVSAFSGQIQAYNRDSSAWLDLIQKGNNLQFFANGSERLRIDTSGQVGIGTTSIDRLLHVQGAGTSGTQVQIEGTSASAGLKFVPASGDNWEVQATTDSALIVYNRTDTAERLRIDSSGNVGIGVNSLSSSSRLTLLESAGNAQTLEIKGANSGGAGSQPGVRFSSFNGDNIGGIFGDTGSDALRIQTGGTDRVFVTNAGNVGIGDSSPGHKLVVKDAGASNTSNYLNVISGNAANAGIAFGDTDTDLVAGVLYNHTDNALRFFQNGFTEAARIDSSGNVLVGTTDSTIYNNGDSDSEGIVLRDGEVIDIARKGDLQLTLNRQTNDGHHIGFFRSGSAKSYIATRNDGFCIDVNGSERMRVGSDGKVYFGDFGSAASAGYIDKATSGSYELDIVASRSTTTNRDIRFFSRSNQESMRIDTNGNLGIGTTSITERLTVFSNNDSSAVDNGLAVYRSAGDDKVNINCQGGAARFISDGGSSYIPTRFGRYNGTTFVEDVTIDNLGRLLVGTTSASSTATTLLLQGSPDGASGPSYLRIATGTATPSSTGTIGQISFTDSGHSTAASIIAFRDGGSWSSSSKPTKLTFSTTANGASTATARMVIDSSGNVAIGSTSAPDKLNVGSTSNGFTAIRILTSNTGNGEVRFGDSDSGNAGYIRYAHNGNHLIFARDGAEAMRVSSGGSLLIGATSTTNLIRLGQKFAVSTNSEFGGGSFTGFNGTTANRGPIIDLQRSRGTSTVGTVVASGDRLGSLVFRGDDGTDFADAAFMLGEVDGTPTGGFVPGRLAFYTGTTSAAPVERLRIKSDGTLHVLKSGTHITNAEQTVAVFQRSSASGSTSKISIISGNAASSHVNFGDTDDEDTGMIAYVHSTNAMQFHTDGNVERMRLDSSGRLLLGTTTEGQSGAENLTLAGSGFSGMTIRSGTAEAGQIAFSDGTSGASEYRGQIYYHHGDDYMRFRTDSIERLRITSTGAWAIEGASNYGTSGQVLTSNGNDSPTWQSPGAGAQISTGNTNVECVDTGSDGHILFDTEGAERMRIDSSGRVGIGTSLPGARLEVVGSDDANNLVVSSGNTDFAVYNDDTIGEARLVAEDGTTNNNPKFLTLYTQASGASSPTERMRIDSSGFVGIGETSPQNNGGGQLTVKRSSTATTGLNGVLRLKQGSATNGNRASLVFSSLDNFNVAAVNGVIETHAGSESNNVGRLEFYTKASGSSIAERMRIDSSGNVGIGETSPAAKLDVAGNVLLSAANPQIQFNSGGPIVKVPSANTLAFLTDSTNERMRVDSSGRLLVGLSSARANFFNSVVAPHFQIEGAGDFNRQSAIISSSSNATFGAVQILAHQKSGAVGGNTLVSSGDQLGLTSFQGSDGAQFVEGARIEAFVDGTPGSNDMPGRLVFSTTADGATSTTERMRITKNGHIQLGGVTTQVPGLGNTTVGCAYEHLGGNGGAFFASRADGPAYFGNRNNDGALHECRRSGNLVGTISVNSSSTAYNTSSDHRLKENVVALSGAITRVKQLAPKRFNFIVDPDATVDGFLAHEAATVVPEAVTGTHNEVDAENNPVYQGIDQSKLVPLLTAALQEAIAKIETLETKVAALEAQ